MLDWNLKEVQEAFILFIKNTLQKYAITHECLSKLGVISKDTISNILTRKTKPVLNSRKQLFTRIAQVINKLENLSGDKEKTWLTLQEEFEQFYLSTRNEKVQNEPKVYQQKNESSHESVMSAFYFPIQLGKLIKHAISGRGPQDRHCNPLENPLGWKEETEHVSQKYFEREAPEQVLTQWQNEKEGIFLILGEPGGGKTTILNHWKSLFDASFAVTYIALRQQACIPSPPAQRETKLTPVWLLDGWDELTVDQRKLDTVNQLPGIKIITCRTASYHGELDEALPEDHIRYLMGMLPNAQRQFLGVVTK